MIGTILVLSHLLIIAVVVPMAACNRAANDVTHKRKLNKTVKAARFAC